ncbi:unnamed protein product, partial [Ixodes hexagonus]
CGAVHDGDIPHYGPQGHCRSEDGYLLSVYGFGEKSNKFSPCSKKQISAYMLSVPKECFDVQKTTNLLQNIEELPGEKINLTAYCNALYPEAVTYARKVRLKPGANKNCQLVCCMESDKDLCAFTPAPDGMSCGVDKICVGGECVNKTRS